MNATLTHLLSDTFDGFLLDEHLADLRKSGLTDETIERQKFCTVPRAMLRSLLGFDMPGITSAYLLPFVDVKHGGWLDFARVKIFPALQTAAGTIKYLQPSRSGVRIFYPLATLNAVLRSTEPLYVVEGEKKCLSVAQEALPTIGVCGIQGWHVGGSRALHPDLYDVVLFRREVRLIPDADVATNPAVHHAVDRLVDALRRRGVARVDLLHVPPPHKGVDDYLGARNDITP